MTHSARMKALVKRLSKPSAYDHHRDMAGLVLDAGLLDALMERTSPPDRNGCMVYRGLFYGKGIAVEEAGTGKAVVISTNRVAYYFGHGVRLGRDEEAYHVCANDGSGDLPLCVCPDHLERQTIAQRYAAVRGKK